jgi:rubredoxin
MDLHPAAGATVVQVISATVATLRNARDLAKDSSNRELKEVIGDAFDSLLDLKERMLALDEENRELKAKLAKKASVTESLLPYGYVYKAEDSAKEHPLCPECYRKHEAIHPLPVATPWGDGTRRRCGTCGWIREEEATGSGSVRLGSMTRRR